MDSFKFIAVKKDSLDKLPVGIKKFVTKFFEPRVIFGIECLVAMGGEYKAPWNGIAEDEEAEYCEGLSQKEIKDYGFWSYLEKNSEVIFNYRWS